MRKIYVVLIIALMLGSTLVAAGFLDKITGALSFSNLFKPKTVAPITPVHSLCSVLPDSDGSYNIKINQCAIVGGKIVKLVEVGSTGSIVVEVNGVSKIVSKISPQIVDGIVITIVSLHPDQKKQINSYAVLYLVENNSVAATPVGTVTPTLSNCKVATFSGNENTDGNGACQKLGKSCVFVNHDYKYFDYASNNCMGAKKINMVYYIMIDCQTKIVDNTNCQGGGTTEMRSGEVNRALCC